MNTLYKIVIMVSIFAFNLLISYSILNYIYKLPEVGNEELPYPVKIIGLGIVFIVVLFDMIVMLIPSKRKTNLN